MKIKIGWYLVCFTLFFVLCGCVSNRSANPKNHKIADVTNGEWVLLSVRDDVQSEFTSPGSEHTPTLQMDNDEKYSGFDGCNRFYGKYILSGDSIKFDLPVSTLKACLDNQSIDQILHSAFEQITNYSIEQNKLILKKHSEPLIIYKK